MKKRGFTIVELVIVIAVIAILAAVLIPTFSNVIEKAEKSKSLQNFRNVFTQMSIIAQTQGDDINGTIFSSGDYYYKVDGNMLVETKKEDKLKGTLLQNDVYVYNQSYVTIADEELAKELQTGENEKFYALPGNLDKLLSFYAHDIKKIIIIDDNGKEVFNWVETIDDKKDRERASLSIYYDASEEELTNARNNHNCTYIKTKEEAIGWYKYILTDVDKEITGYFYYGV